MIWHLTLCKRREAGRNLTDRVLSFKTKTADIHLKQKRKGRLHLIGLYFKWRHMNLVTWVSWKISDWFWDKKPKDWCREIEKRIKRCGGLVRDNYDDLHSWLTNVKYALPAIIYFHEILSCVKYTWHLFIFQGVQTNETENISLLSYCILLKHILFSMPSKVVCLETKVNYFLLMHFSNEQLGLVFALDLCRPAKTLNMRHNIRNWASRPEYLDVSYSCEL